MSSDEQKRLDGLYTKWAREMRDYFANAGKELIEYKTQLAQRKKKPFVFR